MMKWTRTGGALAALALAASTAAAQRAPRLTRAETPAALRTLDFSASSLAWVDDSAVALIDSDAKQLVVAGIRSGSLRRAGRQGGGPGEFRTPIFVLAENGEIIVDDIGARRLSRFDATAKFVAFTPTPGATLQLLAADRRRVRLAWLGFTPDGGGPMVSDIDLATGKATPRFSVFAQDSALAVTTDASQGPSPFLTIAAGRNGEILAGSPQTYRISVFDSSGRRLRTLSRKLPEAFRTDAEVEEIVQRSGRVMQAMAAAEGGGGAQLAEFKERLRKQPKPHFSMGGIAVDGEGRTWVSTSRGGSRTEIDVFGADGAFLGTVPVDGKVSALALRLPWLAVLSERTSGEDEGLEGIDLYRVGAGQ